MDDHLARILEELVPPCCGNESVYLSTSGERFTCKNLPDFYIEYANLDPNFLCADCRRHEQDDEESATPLEISSEAKALWKEVTDRWTKVGGLAHAQDS